MKIVLDGIDNVGKTTIVNELRKLKSFDIDIHLTAPKSYDDGLEMYSEFFRNLNSEKTCIYDRSHLGEAVYAPIYRGYDGDYVFDMEQLINTNGIRLILLKGDTSIVKDDGLSHNYENREVEQNLFINAFNKSSIVDKRIIEVHKQGVFRDVGAIIKDIL